MQKKCKVAGFSWCEKPQSTGGVRRPMLGGQDTTVGKLQIVTNQRWWGGRAPSPAGRGDAARPVSDFGPVPTFRPGRHPWGQCSLQCDAVRGGPLAWSWRDGDC